MKTLIFLLLISGTTLAQLPSPDAHSGLKPRLQYHLRLNYLDTAMMMMQDFVTIGKDYNLGFANDDEVMHSHIVASQWADVYYMREDSALTDKSKNGSGLFVKQNRRIYPVFQGKKLRASITFDSSASGWMPVIFEDSMAIKKFIDNRKLTIGRRIATNAVVVAPFLKEDIVFEKDKQGSHIRMSNTEDPLLMGEHPTTKTSNAVTKSVKLGDFQKRLVKYHESEVTKIKVVPIDSTNLSH